jgi:hypothetical protein
MHVEGTLLEPKWDIVVRPSEQWFSNSIMLLPPIEKATDLSSLVYNDVEQDHACYPGPLARFIVVHVQEENCAGLIYVVQHSVIDAILISLFLEDLDATLNSTKLKLLIPYKAWADSYYNLQYSITAKVSVNWHVSRLRAISKNVAALFPVQRAPKWFKGCSEGWIDASGKLGPPRKLLTAGSPGLKGITRPTTLKDIRLLKVQHKIHPSQIVRAALANVLVMHTKQPYALFAYVHGGRTWPFMSDWQIASMPAAMDVNGPTIDVTVDRVFVDRQEKVLQILECLQKEQSLLNRYSSVPLNQIISTLNQKQKPLEEPECYEDANCLPRFDEEGKDCDFLIEVIKRMFFNWLPHSYAALDYKRLQNMQLESRADCGCQWNCVMLDETTLSVHLTWDDAQLRFDEMDNMLAEVLKVAELFATSVNWDKKIEELL